jgi:hypothetical protein
MERFRRRDHVAINALWVGVHFQDAALMSIIVPALLLQLAPGNHTYVLAVLSTYLANRHRSCASARGCPLRPPPPARRGLASPDGDGPRDRHPCSPCDGPRLDSC